ncbi:hypothetical protein JVT61DRAFT_11789 [Boletus reticuloceps]|uniref:3-beta hydroxysteroid dehydrogenase/isomerase domain-containing protein n=1 Tax=Boletus reticuloceps TaxID=495285 RepID=A0A8I2YVH3_9AGAM|nr:hypothetical protein JVT61DRAFT_11789 [Boletus reticuloceps]
MSWGRTRAQSLSHPLNPASASTPYITVFLPTAKHTKVHDGIQNCCSTHLSERKESSSIAPTPIVEELVAHGDIVSVLGIGCHDVPFYSGDITELNVILDLIRKLVYTSSAGVVLDGKDVTSTSVHGGAPCPEKLFDACDDSKAKGETLILAANGKGDLLTVSLRPAGIFGYLVSVHYPIQYSHVSGERKGHKG